MTKRDAYHILGLEVGSGLDAIKSAFRRLAKSYHPDLSPAPDSGEQFARLAEAYSLLESQLRHTPVRSPRRSRSKPKPQTPHGSMGVENVYSLGQILVTSNLADLREFAAQNLGLSGRKMAYAFLKHGMFDQEKRVVLASIHSVGTLGVHQSADDLARRYDTGDRDIQLAVLQAVSRIGSGLSFSAVLSRAATSPHPRVRELASRMV